MAEPSRWDRVVELARISMENPAAAAVLRLHQQNDFGRCEECARLDGGDDWDTKWPCPTVQAIEQVAARPAPIPAEAFEDAMQRLIERRSDPRAGISIPQVVWVGEPRYAFVVRWSDGREPELATRNGRLVVSTDKTVLCPPYEAVVFSGDPAWTVRVADESPEPHRAEPDNSKETS